jgi:fatty-acyl-CoA synthase
LAPFLRQLAGDVTLADVVARWARRRPERLALEVSGERLSYAELDYEARAAAATLAALGARSGDVLALLGRNSIAYVALLLGAARAGVTLALVHPELAGEPLRHALSVVQATQVLCERELEAVARAATDLPLKTFDPGSRAPFSSSGLEPATGCDPQRGACDFALVYTSGTMGLPKACRLPHSRVLSAACLFGAPLFDFADGDKLLCALPLYHGSPLLLGLGACLVSGVPLVLERRFSASDFLAAAARSGATALLYVGDLGRMLLSTPESPADRGHGLRVAVGNGMSSQVWTKFQQRFGVAEVREFYAATESPVGLFNWSGRVGSVGNLPYAWMFGLRLARVDAGSGELLRDARGRLVACRVGEAGELLVRARKSGLGVYHGYLDASATEARLVVPDLSDPNGAPLFRTGDLLRRDREGFYYFVERGGDSYRFRGENVSVAQVERELEATPGVTSAVVTGLELAGYDGRVGLAAVVPGADFEIARLEQLQTRLPRSALPRFVRAMSDLPRTASLKLKRSSLAAEGVDPARIGDPLWALLDGHYRRLDAVAYHDILSGAARL